MNSTKTLSMAFGLSLIALSSLSLPAQAGTVVVSVTIENLAPLNSISFAPLRLGFGNGTFDSFNINQAAGAGIVSIAEGGGGMQWFTDFAAADPTSVRGSVGGALLPGATATANFVVDSMSVNNRFFTFANMVIPSNDLFLGNDNPTAFQLFDASGNLLINQITQRAGQIWDANSEQAIVANAAFIPGSVNDNRVAENGLVAFDRTELGVFNGLTTAAGYTFNSTLLPDNNQNIYRISFTASSAPEPGTFALMGVALGLTALTGRRLRRSESA